MSGYLLDTNVVSLLSPSRAEASDQFLDWLERADGEGRVFLSVVTIHEIAKGVALLDSKGASAKAAGLRVWLAGLIAAYDEKILGLDVPAASLSGRAEAKAVAAGHGAGMADAVIAGLPRRTISPSSPATPSILSRSAFASPRLMAPSWTT